MASNKKETSHDYIVRLMTDAGTYDPRFSAQIEDTADTRDMIHRIRKKIGTNFSNVEASYGGKSVSENPNPLLDVLVKLKKVYQGQLSALGLNYDGFKKPDNRVASKESTAENDPISEYFNTVNR